VIQYQHSAAMAVMSEFIETAWKPWLFSRTPRAWWAQASHRFREGDPVATTILFEYLEYLNSKFQVNDIQMWKSPPFSTEIATDTTSVYQLAHFGSIYDILVKYYPNVDWPTTKTVFNKNKPSSTVFLSIASIRV